MFQFIWRKLLYVTSIVYSYRSVQVTLPGWPCDSLLMKGLKMRNLRITRASNRHLNVHRGIRWNNIALVLCLAIVLSILASCGSATTRQSNMAAPQLASPLGAVQLAPPLPQPAILDLRPLSMSIVGHLDCQRKGAYICFARVISRSSNQSNLHWFAFTNVPGHIVFRPSSGVLAPDRSVLVTIIVPFNACRPGLFFFRGPINTHTITWAC